VSVVTSDTTQAMEDLTPWATRRLARMLRGLQRAAIDTLTGMVIAPDCDPAALEAVYETSPEDALSAPDDVCDACEPEDFAIDDAPDGTGAAVERGRESRRGRRGKRGGRRHKRRPSDEN